MFLEATDLEKQTALKTLEDESLASLEKALMAYQSQRLALRFAGDRGVEQFSEDPFKAEAQIKSLLNQGYELRQDAQDGFYFSRGLDGGSPIKALERKLDLKPESQRSIFITYQWGQKDTAIALQKAFEAQGYLVIRDEDTLNNGAYIRDFMKVITHPKLDYVLPIISKSYLLSKNCMYEVNQVMRRHRWEDSLLPYVVSINTEHNARIYDGISSYREHWQQKLSDEKDPDEKEIFENIVKNITSFCSAISTRINVPEKDMVASGYKSLFDLMNQHENEREGTKFKEIEELLRVAMMKEKLRKFEESQKLLDNAIEKVDAILHLEGTEAIAAKVYGQYGEYLKRRGKAEEAQEKLEIAKELGYSDTISMQSLNLSSPTPALSSTSPSATATQSPQNNVLIFTPAKAAAPSINTQELSQFLSLVAQGEQSKAEAMIQRNPALLLVPGTVNDLAGRNFTGVDPEIAKRGGNGVREFRDITALQYAVWALDWHMWKMLLKYLPAEEARLQAQAFETGPWVSTHGAHAGPQLQGLITALKTYIDNYDPWTAEQCKAHWCKQVGGSQLLLPADVFNEYCNPKRPFEPCPNFEDESELPRTRKVTIDKEYDDVFTAKYDGGSLGNSFALYRALAEVCWGGYGGGWSADMVRRVSSDHRAITALCSTRTQQRDRLISELCNSSTFESTRVAARR